MLSAVIARPSPEVIVVIVIASAPEVIVAQRALGTRRGSVLPPHHDRK
jgi:hypothetical protein